MLNVCTQAPVVNSTAEVPPTDPRPAVKPHFAMRQVAAAVDGPGPLALWSLLLTFRNAWTGHLWPSNATLCAALGRRGQPLPLSTLQDWKRELRARALLVDASCAGCACCTVGRNRQMRVSELRAPGGAQLTTAANERATAPERKPEPRSSERMQNASVCFNEAGAVAPESLAADGGGTASRMGGVRPTAPETHPSGGDFSDPPLAPRKREAPSAAGLVPSPPNTQRGGERRQRRVRNSGPNLSEPLGGRGAIPAVAVTPELVEQLGAMPGVTMSPLELRCAVAVAVDWWNAHRTTNGYSDPIAWLALSIAKEQRMLDARAAGARAAGFAIASADAKGARSMPIVDDHDAEQLRAAAKAEQQARDKALAAELERARAAPDAAEDAAAFSSMLSSSLKKRWQSATTNDVDEEKPARVIKIGAAGCPERLSRTAPRGASPRDHASPILAAHGLRGALNPLLSPESVYIMVNTEHRPSPSTSGNEGPLGSVTASNRDSSSVDSAPAPTFFVSLTGKSGGGFEHATLRLPDQPGGASSTIDSTAVRFQGGAT